MGEGPDQMIKPTFCPVLRGADSKAETSLLSDLLPRLPLHLECTEPMVESSKGKSYPDNMPLLMIVCEQRSGRQWSTYAKLLPRGSLAFGGNRLWSNDPCFPFHHPIRIHDAPGSF